MASISLRYALFVARIGYQEAQWGRAEEFAQCLLEYRQMQAGQAVVMNGLYPISMYLN